MDGFSVDLDELDRVADDLRSAGEQVDANSVLQYSIAPRSSGNEALADALAALNRASQHALATMRADTAEAADRILESLHAYLEADSSVADLLTGFQDAADPGTRT